ncbi:MAG: hypothetical protein ACRERV_05780 [Methylococcales bacterium]
MLYVITVLVESSDGSEEKHQRSFGGFKRDRRALVTWLIELGVQLVVAWKAPASIGKASTRPCKRLAFPRTSSMPAACQKRTRPQDRHIRFRVARPTRALRSAVKPSFIPPEDLRELRGQSL